MKKEDITLGMEVKVRGKGIAEVIDLCPTYKCYVKVRLNSGEETMYDVVYMSPAPPPKAKKPLRSFNPDPAPAYAFMGWCAVNSNLWMPTSAPPEDFQNAWEDIYETQKTDPTGVTKKAEGSIGTCFDMVISKPSCDTEKLGKALGVEFHDFFGEAKASTVLLYGARKCWFFHFLRHGFKDGKGPRDLQAIRATVPADYQKHFDAGTKGDIL